MKTSLSRVSSFTSSARALNGHCHTIGPALLHHPQKPDTRRIKIPTPDHDFLELDVIDAQNNEPAVALFHGLEGSTNRCYMIDLMKQLAAKDYSVVAVNFRSCGSRMNQTRRFYHSGETEDLHTVFNWMQQQFPQSALGAAGFSLGGNALLKFMGEKGRRNPVQAAVAVSVPYNLKTGSLNIGRGFNQIYQWRFLRSLRKKLKLKQKTFPGLPDFNGSTLYDFDDQVTGPIHGFKGAEDYYARCSSNQFISQIRQPTLCVHSRQDPLCPIADVPLTIMQKNKQLDYIITDRGGHVGFWGSPQGWLNQTIMNYFQQKID